MMIPAVIGFLAIYEWHIDIIAPAVALVHLSVIVFAGCSSEGTTGISVLMISGVSFGIGSEV
jgi:hypothetical protein